MTGCGEDGGTVSDLRSREVRLPNGTKITAETMVLEMDMMRGMMFRDALARDRGMLFAHSKPGNYSYWMYQVKIPLDIIWMDSRHQIVEISANTPPCRTKASECPSYGGKFTSQYVLELAGGMAGKYGLSEGQVVGF